MKGKTRGRPAATHELADGFEAALPQPKPLTSASERSGLVPKRILVPTDFSECSLRAVEYAADLARALGARLILLHVAEPAMYGQNPLDVSPASEDVNQNLINKCRERLAAVIDARIAHCAPDQFLVRLGHAHSEITDTAVALGADLIVLGTHGNIPSKPEFLGSSAERVVRHAGCPVLTVRQEV
jgi:nucleotide-binding universal stress UspA family protein